MALPLPEDAVADVFRRLPPRSLAASRCVCKEWRSIIDGRLLLRSVAELLPHSQSVRGIFLMCDDLSYPVFLSRPHPDPSLHFSLPDFFSPASGWRRRFAFILDHCNGLLLYRDRRGLHVANPAMQRRAPLPPPPQRFALAGPLFLSYAAHLVFDPTDSPHYEVLLIPDSPRMEKQCQAAEPSISNQHEREWPPPSWVICVFSSRTGEWEDRAFAREGEAESDVAAASWEGGDRWLPLRRPYGAYWRRAFFVQCLRASRIIRISLSNGMYRVIKVPTDLLESDRVHACLGTSHAGLCCASFGSDDWSKLQIWILDESCGHIQWVLKHQVGMNHSISRVPTCGPRAEGPWILQDANNGEYHGQLYPFPRNVNDDDDSKDALITREFEWDSDNDNILSNECEDEEQSYRAYSVSFLGFHPYKDVVYLDVSLSKAVAYHLNTSMVQVLGNECPEYYEYAAGPGAHIASSFLYTPCLMTVP